MPFQIEGAKGNRIVEVDDEGNLHVAAIIESDMESENEEGFAWSMPFDAVDPTGADDAFLYIQNTESSKTLHIRKITLSSSVVGRVEVIRVTGTRVGGSGVTLVNFNEGFSASTPAGVFETGSDITGLAKGGKYAFRQLAVADTDYEIFFGHDIILNRNGAVALNWIPGTGALTGTVEFFLHK